MRRLGHPATLVAAAALFIALGGGAYAASQSISGNTIKNNSIAENKLTAAAIVALTGQQTLTYDAKAVASPSGPTKIGTVLDATFGAECLDNGSAAYLIPYVKTTDGSWAIDYTELDSIAGVGSTFVGTRTYAAKTLTSFVSFDIFGALAGDNVSDRQFNIVQLKPSAGSLVLHGTVITTSAPSATCHMSIQSFPTPLTAGAGAGHAPSGMTTLVHHSLHLGPN